MKVIPLILALVIVLLVAIKALNASDDQQAATSTAPYERVTFVRESRAGDEAPTVTGPGGETGRIAASSPSIPSMGASPISNWSESPDVIESRLRSYLSSGEVGALWDDEVRCTRTQCAIFFTKSSRLNFSESLRFTAFVRGSDVGASGVGLGGDEMVDGLYRHAIEISTPREPLPNDYPSLGMTSEELRQFGARYLSPDDLYAPPVVLELGEGKLSIVIENICSTDCPLDRQQIVHWQSPTGLSCEETGAGGPQEFLVRAEDGSFQNRTFCIEAPIPD